MFTAVDARRLEPVVARVLDLTERAHGSRRACLVGIVGAVGVGKTTFAADLAERIRQISSEREADPSLRVVEVSTDGFLLSNAELDRRGLTARKGFPESYDTGALMRFLRSARSGESRLAVPRYSHVRYDRIDGDPQWIVDADVVVLDGLTLLQSIDGASDESGRPSDLLDLAIYLDADERDVQKWWVERFLRMRVELGSDPDSYLHEYADLGDEEVAMMGDWVWDNINGPNLHDHIGPSRSAADVVILKGSDHRIVDVIEITPTDR